MDQPAYQEYTAEGIPVVETDSATVKVVIGEFNGTASPIQDEITAVNYLDIQIKAGERFGHEFPETNHTFVYVFEGGASVGGQALKEDEMVSLNGGVELVAGEQGARFLLVSGQPIKEPIVQYGPFVMNTREEIDTAMRDYQSNNFVRDKAWLNRVKAK